MSNADWWAKRLGESAPATSQGRPTGLPPMPPSQQPMTPFQPQVNPSASRAQSASQTQTCPDCGSGNYMAVANAAYRCYDCGYPIQQSGSRFGALTGASVEGPTQQAHGNATANNWNPQGIIGRIGE